MRTFPSLLLCVSLGACSSSSTPAATGAPPSHAPATASPSPPSAHPGPPPAIRFSSAACGFGGSATAVSAFVDVEADAAATGVTATFELRDPSGGTVYGRNQGPVTLLVSPAARGVNDFSTQGTTPFSGSLAAGDRVRLQTFAGLDGTPPMGAAVVRTTFHDAGGTQWVVDCTAPSMWPSS